MKIHRFFVEKPIGEEKDIYLADLELYHQLKDVLRFQVGAEFALFDGSLFEYRCRLTGFEIDGVRVEVVKKTEIKNDLPHEVYLFFALIKKDNAEWVLEKGTEIGITNFIPILSDRSEKKNLNYPRAEKIIKEAAEQSGKSILPKLHPIQSLENALNNFSLHFITLDPTGKPFRQYPLLDKTEKVGIFVGPEGGWSSNELAFFKRNKISVLSLGKQILRAETASIAISSLLLF